MKQKDEDHFSFEDLFNLVYFLDLAALLIFDNFKKIFERFMIEKLRNS